MPQYRVWSLRKFYTELTVEADSMENAKIKALATLQAKPATDFTWQDAQDDDRIYSMVEVETGKRLYIGDNHA